jgi:O-antigen/teichoic acid export membrane protein
LATKPEGQAAKIVGTIFSEAILSVSNLVLGIVVARYAPKTEYGTYIILFSLLGIVGGYQNALIHGPLMVLVNHKDDGAKRQYVGGLAAASIYVFGSALLLLLAASIVYAWWAELQGTYVVQIAVLCAVAAAWVAKEFLRTLHFVELETVSILRMDLTHVAVVACGALILTLAIGKIAAVSALLLLGGGYLASAASAVPGVAPWFSEGRTEARRALAENWVYGKWSTLGATWSLLRDRGYLYIVSVLLGLEVLADISAARLFLMPIGLLNVSSTRIALAKGSKQLAGGRVQNFRRFFSVFVAGLLVVWAAYFGIMAVLPSSVIVYSLGEKYLNAKDLLPLWGVYFGVYTLRYQLGTALGVCKRFKETAQYDLLGSGVALVLCGVFAVTLGRFGPVLALIVGESLTAMAYFRLYRGIRQSHDDLSEPSALASGRRVGERSTGVSPLI